MSPVVRNDWDKVGDQARPRAVAAVAYAASNTVTRAGMLSRVDTGAMRGGWKIRTENGGLKATIYNTQAYAIFHEEGTKRMSAQPMLGPALDAVEGTFLLMLRQVLGPRLGS